MCTVMLLNIARSPWAPAQAPQDASALILRPSTGTVERREPGWGPAPQHVTTQDPALVLRLVRSAAIGWFPCVKSCNL